MIVMPDSLALVGRRIRLVEMPNDPSPIEAGAEGTVTNARWIDLGDESCPEGCPKHRYWEIWVDWDNGRTLHLVSPPDRFEVIERKEET